MALAASQPQQPALQNISDLLESFTASLDSTGTSLPSTKRESPTEVSILPPQDGISLLDTKCDLLLSYLQNLVFLMLLQLRELPSNNSSENDEDDKSNQLIRSQVTSKLIELRTYLDRGVRPLEGRLKYQVDKVIKAAEEVERAGKGAQTAKPKSKRHDESGSEAESASENAGSEEDDSEEDEDIDEMAYRPNVSAFSKRAEPTARADRAAAKASDGIYRPPKIMPTAMPTTERKERKERVDRRSNVIDEFVSAEMSSAPMAEPSIGSTIVSGGRHTKSRKERQTEAERTRYEETNFVRLAGESKKEKAKKAASRRAEGTFGGEEWKGLTDGADRITRLTSRAKGSNALERSRKRKPTEDGQRGDGVGVGQIFEKRRKKVEGWKR
ncbi:Sas10/Utp3/C1D family-domain-containing protein [Aspergillus crustosus]